MKLYDLVKKLLESRLEIRDSDRKLIWAVFYRLGLLKVIDGEYYLSRKDFYRAPSCESITRARRKVQEDFPILASTIEVQQRRKLKQETNGNFIYHEKLTTL